MAVRAEQIAACLHALGHVDSYTGDYDEGLRCLTEAIARFEAAGIRAGVVSGWCNMAVLLIRQGRLDEAEEAARPGIAGSEEIGSVFWRVRALHSAGEVEQLRGRPLQAALIMRESAEGCAAIREAGCSGARRGRRPG